MLIRTARQAPSPFVHEQKSDHFETNQYDVFENIQGITTSMAQEYLENKILQHPKEDSQNVSAIHDVWKLDAFFPSLRRPISNERLVDTIFAHSLCTAVDSLELLYTAVPNVFWSTLLYSQSCQTTIATALEMLSFYATIESMTHSLIDPHIRQLRDKNQRDTFDEKELAEMKMQSAEPLHDLRKMLLCVLHRASGADEEWNKSDVSLSRRRLEQIMTVIFDVHAVVTLVTCYWRTDAEIVREILKQLPTKVVDDTVQAFVVATPKMCASNQLMLSRNEKLRNFSASSRPDQIERIVSDICTDVVRLSNWLMTIELCSRALPALAYNLRQNCNILRELARWQSELSDFAMPLLKRDEGITQQQNLIIARLSYTERQLAKVLRAVIECALLPVMSTLGNTSRSDDKKSVKECEQEAREAYLRANSLHAAGLHDASQYEEFMLTLLNNCAFFVLIYDHIYNIAREVEKFQCGAMNVVCPQLHTRLQQEHDRVTSGVLHGLHDTGKLDSYIDGTWKCKYNAVADELCMRMRDSAYGANFIRFFVFYCARAAEKWHREEQMRRASKDPKETRTPTDKELVATLREWLDDMNKESLMWCVPKAVRMCQNGSDRLFAVDSSDIDDVTRVLESDGARIDGAISAAESEARRHFVDEGEAKPEMVPISHGKGRERGIVPISVELQREKGDNVSGTLSDFYARYREEQAYVPIDQGDYSLYDLYDDERDDTYDDLEPGVADGDDPDRLLVQHRLNAPIEEEENNDEEDTTTESSEKTSSAPPVRHHTTRNPSAYTGGRERQMKERHSAHNRRARADAKRRGFF